MRARGLAAMPILFSHQVLRCFHKVALSAGCSRQECSVAGKSTLRATMLVSWDGSARRWLSCWDVIWRNPSRSCFVPLVRTIHVLLQPLKHAVDTLQVTHHGLCVLCFCGALHLCGAIPC